MKITREQRARTVQERVRKGPSVALIGIDHTKLTKSEVIEYFAGHYRNWAETWVLPDLEVLIPELRNP